MLLKGQQELENVLNNFLSQFECTALLDTDFHCLLDKNIITYTFVMAESHSKTFMDRVNRLYPDIKADEFLWSFLHEVGHIETIDLLDDNEYEYSHNVKLDRTNLTDEIYYELPDEYEATLWAANYMRNHTNEVATLWNEIQKAIMNIYILNDIH